jgi:hypothetical protein
MCNKKCCKKSSCCPSQPSAHHCCPPAPAPAPVHCCCNSGGGDWYNDPPSSTGTTGDSDLEARAIGSVSALSFLVKPLAFQFQRCWELNNYSGEKFDTIIAKGNGRLELCVAISPAVGKLVARRIRGGVSKDFDYVSQEDGTVYKTNCDIQPGDELQVALAAPAGVAALKAEAQRYLYSLNVFCYQPRR